MAKMAGDRGGSQCSPQCQYSLFMNKILKGLRTKKNFGKKDAISPPPLIKGAYGEKSDNSVQK